jgi:hypothetical protein
MSFWGDFVDSIKNAGKGVLGINPGAVVLQAGASLAGTGIKDPQMAANAGIVAQQGVQKKLEDAGIASVDTAPMKALDPVLFLGEKAEKYVFSPIIARPISTLNLLSDPNSKLYQGGQFGKGFQLSDIKDAYNRSADVSLGQSMLKSPFNLLGLAESQILEANGVDVSGIDLWDNNDIKKNFQDNVLGKYITGFNDFIIKNVAINAAFAGAGAVAKAGATRAGLTTKFKAADVEAMPKFEEDMYSHIDGRGQTVIGQDVVDLAASENIVDITRIVKKHSYNRELPDLIKSTKDPKVVADFLLADKGYGPAIDRLTKLNLADDLWVMGEGTATFRSEYIVGGKLPQYTAEQRNRWMQAFDDAIKKEPKHQEVYDAFLTQELDESTGLLNVEPLALGKNYKPMEPIGLQGAAGKARSKAGKIKTAVLERDFTNPEIGGVAQTVLGGRMKGPVTVLLRNFGTYMPKGLVSNSGLRPFNGVEELMSVFDDIPLFRDGTRVVETHDLNTMTASDYRRNLIDKFVSAKNDGERGFVVDSANKEIALTIAHSRGYYDDAKVLEMVDELMQDVYSMHGNLRQYGHSMDPTGVRVSVDVKTQRQLQNALPMLPLGDLDRMILKAARAEKSVVKGAATKAEQLTATAARNTFEASSRIFSVAQLYRFSYIPKNSVFEPMLAATLAEGSNFAVPMITTAAKNAIKGSANLVMRNIEKSKTLLPSAKKEIQREVKALSEEYNQAIIIRDQVYANYESHFGNTPGVSPATKRDWADQIKEALREAERDVANLEGKLNTYTIEYGKPVQVPSVYGLRSRIETLKAAGSVRYASEIRSAEITLQKAVGEINTLAPELNIIDTEIAKSYDRIGAVLEALGPKQIEQSSIFSVAEGRYATKPLLPQRQKVQLSNGQTLEFESFASRKGFGEGYMSEIANNSTRNLEFLGNKATVAKINTILGSSPKTITNVADPVYFDELAYVVNNHMRGDILVDRILSGQSREQLLEWAATGQARKYAVSMGSSPDDLVRMIDEQITYVNRYLPTSEAKLAAAQDAVNPTQLRGILGDKLDQMVPIQPLEIEYANPTSFAKSAAKTFDTAFAGAWRFLMKPENMIREVWGTTRHTALVAERAERLVAQGYSVDLSTLNRIHHAAAMELVDETAKVFYTIPRQHKALYLARAIATFPNAAASGIYRYSRFAVQKPKRFAGFLNSYYGLYNSFGVDQNGNPVDDPMKAQYLLIPGTKEMGLNDGKGVIINARATNYVANFPGASWIAPIALSKIFAGKPNSEDEIKKSINKTIGKIPGYSYEEMFPYGIEPNTGKQVLNTFTPAWARNLKTFLAPDKTDKMFVDSWISESNRQWILYDMQLDKNPKYKGPAPTPDSIMAGAKSIYLRKFRTQFFSLLGTPQYVDSRPDSIYQDYFFMLVNNNTAKGMSSTESYKTAEKQFQSHMLKTTGANFPMERLFVSSQDSLSYITPSVKAYNRIWEDFPGLATTLRQVDPSVVGLMVADLPKEYSPQINKFLNSTTARLPDGTMVNSALKTPQLVEEEIEKSRFWSAYTVEKNRLNKIAKDAGYTSYLSVPELKDSLRAYANESLGPASRAWYSEYQKSATKGNQAWIQSQGLFTVVQDKNFMNKFGKTQFWQHAKAFVQYRNEYAAAYADAPSGSKADVKDAWAKYLASSYNEWDPVLQRMITRYFENDNMRENK